MLAWFHDFHGWDLGALWEDTKFATTHCTKIERLALVGEEKNGLVGLEPRIGQGLIEVRHEARNQDGDLSIEGTAVTSVKIDGVVHVPSELAVGEFTDVRIIDALGPDLVAAGGAVIDEDVV